MERYLKQLFRLMALALILAATPIVWGTPQSDSAGANSDGSTTVTATREATVDASTSMTTTQDTNDDARPEERDSAQERPDRGLRDRFRSRPAADLFPRAADRATTPGGPETRIVMNFENADINTFLEYVSKAAGYVIIKEVDVEGTVNVESQQPITRETVLDVLNTVLSHKGYAAIRNENTLRILRRDDAMRSPHMLVERGADPAEIPVNDEIVHQIMPLGSADVTQLMQNIESLLPDDAIITANQGNNALILTTSRAHINRVARIIKALDTAIPASSIRVFKLNYADATQIAKVIQALFQMPATAGASRGGRGGGGDPRREMMEMMQRRMEGGGGGAPAGAGAALTASMRVVATADEQSNSLVISAQDATMETIAALIREMDQPTENALGVRIFTLMYADANEMAEAISTVFESESGTSSRNNRTGGRPRMPWDRGRDNEDSTQSQRTLKESKVIATPDTRTNSVIVAASSGPMAEIADFIQKLDVASESLAKIQIYGLNSADAEEMAELIAEVFKSPSASSSSSRNNRTGGFRGFFGGGGGRFGGGATNQASTTRQSQGKQDLVEVTAVADTRTNSVIVSASEETHVQVQELIKSIDGLPEIKAELRVINLKHADAEEMANTINEVYQSNSANTRGSYGSRGGRSGSSNMRSGPTAPGMTSREMEEVAVSATADLRTNSVVVSAAGPVLDQIEEMVKSLDQDPARTQKVYVHQLDHANPEELQYILQTMFSGNGTRSNRSSTNRSSTTRTSSRNTNNRNTGGGGNTGGRLSDTMR